MRRSKIRYSLSCWTVALCCWANNSGAFLYHGDVCTTNTQVFRWTNVAEMLKKITPAFYIQCLAYWEHSLQRCQAALLLHSLDILHQRRQQFYFLLSSLEKSRCTVITWWLYCQHIPSDCSSPLLLGNDAFFGCITGMQQLAHIVLPIWNAFSSLLSADVFLFLLPYILSQNLEKGSTDVFLKSD